ncbi:hypothetical protein [Roseofilum capinflatum]|uniref:Transposase n=1 Tax=Roseofilum capinflatum BLCC-M114 TaxID=3022440 RepID=A0ABT7B7L2_9CYAN|nr:hypothetical protein [Roseofilum capinflatum]MDJ1174604.1 hypothetical protein [Roseofilum capinflatum BLCC-M114]
MSTDGEYLIAAQYTTYYNYSGQKQMSGLGVIQGKVRGLIQHNILLLSQSGVPLGLLGQQHWTREGGKDLPDTEKESQKWLKGMDAINQQASQLHQSIVVVADREADVFDLFRAEREANVELLVRVGQDRHLEIVSSKRICKLSDVSSELPDLGTTLRGCAKGDSVVCSSMERRTLPLHSQVGCFAGRKTTV